jgi:hypothetical protein
VKYENSKSKLAYTGKLIRSSGIKAGLAIHRSSFSLWYVGHMYNIISHNTKSSPLQILPFEVNLEHTGDSGLSKEIRGIGII